MDVLAEIIFTERNKYWRTGSGDSGLGIQSVRKRQDGTRIQAGVSGEPSLVFWLVEKHGFFFIYFDASTTLTPTQYVPFAGGRCSPWVKHDVGGESFYAPRACFVSRPFAWQIVYDFVESKSKSKAVPWLRRDKLEFPYPAAGDPVPKREHLA